MSDHSTAALPAKLIAEVCNRFLTKREKIISSKRAELVAEKMNSRKYGLFGNKLTEEEATERLRLGGISSDWYSVSFRGCYWVNKVQELKVLADIAIQTGAESVNVTAQLSPC